MTAFTSTQSGNWNDSATWGGGGYPSSAADTATISAQHDITVPAGTTSTCGAVTFTAGIVSNETKLIISGTFEMGGAITTAAYSRIYLGAGATLDLNGNNVVCGGSYTYYEFKGTASSRATLTSTGSAGSFTNTTNVLLSDWDYVDVTGLGDSVFGRTHNVASLTQTYLHSTFTGCGSLDLEATGTGADASIRVAYCDFRNPSSATPETSAKMYPNIYQSGTLGSRIVEYCTWDTDALVNNVATFRMVGGICRYNVFNDVKIYSYYATQQYIGNFFAGAKLSSNEYFKDTGGLNKFLLMQDNYFYYSAADHPTGYSEAISSKTITGNVFENTGVDAGGYGCNWFLFNTFDAGQSISVKNNIFIGTGSAVTFTGNAAPTLLDISNNTFYIDNDGVLGSGIAFAPILITEQASTLTGTVEIYNNLVIDPDTSTSRDEAVGLLNNTADQIDYLDYNAGWGYPGGAFTPPLLYGANVVVTAGEGVNDISVDPQFIDHTRDIAAWDAALGGAGTAANAITELLKLNSSGFNSSYSISALTLYVSEGFRPTSSSLQVSGRNTAYIGFRIPVFFFCAAVRADGGAGTVRTIWSDAGTNTGYIVRINASNQLELAAGDGSAYTLSATTDTLTVGTMYVVTAWDDGINLNVQVNSGTTTSVARPIVSPGTASSSIGSDNAAASGFFNGAIGTVVMRKHASITTNQIAAVKSYVAGRHGVSM